MSFPVVPESKRLKTLDPLPQDERNAQVRLAEFLQAYRETVHPDFETWKKTSVSPFDPSQELGGLYVEGIREADDIVQTDVSFPTLDRTNICSMQVSSIREFLLRESKSDASLAYVSP